MQGRRNVSQQNERVLFQNSTASERNLISTNVTYFALRSLIFATNVHTLRATLPVIFTLIRRHIFYFVYVSCSDPVRTSGSFVPRGGIN